MCINPKIFIYKMHTLTCEREVKRQSNDYISSEDAEEMCYSPAFGEKLSVVVIVVSV
jgi:hypothetical protein